MAESYVYHACRLLLSGTWMLLVTLQNDFTAACQTCLGGTCDALSDKCVCEPHFLGAHCEQVDLTSAKVSVGARTALFVWVNKKELTDIAFVCYRHAGQGTIFIKKAEQYRTGIIAKELTSSTKYTICAVHLNQSNGIYMQLVSSDVNSVPGCVEVQTSKDSSSIYKTVAVIAACVLIGSVAVLIIARFVVLFSHQKTLTINNIPQSDSDDATESVLFDFLDGILHMDDPRGRMLIRTISRQHSSRSDGMQDVKVEFFNSRDRREVFKMAKLQKQQVDTSFGAITLKPGKKILRHSRSMSDSGRPGGIIYIGHDQLAVTI